MWTDIKHVIDAGGKRMRPYLAMVGYGEYSERMIPVAAAQELLHVAILIHDDIIDRDTVRHGTENVTGRYINRYNKLLSDGDARHYADGSSILAGDLLISEAYQAINSSDFDSDTKQRVITRFHQALFDVVGGELLDVEAAFDSSQPIDPLLIANFKTSSYSFIGPLLAGAYCRGAGQTTIDLLTTYGEHVGIAFQFQDDLLGIFGDSSETGKSVVTDLCEGKATYLIDLYKKTLSDQDRASFDSVFGNKNATEQDLLELKQRIAYSSAPADVEQRVEHHFQAALEAAEQLTSEFQRVELRYVVDALRGRKA
jgi:geranylgeranyl pyrophosphate synthase